MGALKRSAQYWAKRFDQLTDAQLNKGADFYRNIAEQYEKAAAAAQKDIEAWYMRFARNQAITLTEAKRLLNTRELKEFKWTVEEYIEKGKTLNYSKAWAKQLENASARFHVSRLEALQLQMQQQAELLYGYELDGLDALARQIYTEGYYHTAHIIQTGVGVGWDFMRLNTNLIDKVISKPWAADGADFSARLWKSRSQLVAALNDSLVQSIIRGQSPAQTIDLIRGKFKTSREQAGRLVMTESAYFSSAAQHDSFKALDVERYQIVATLDRLTSEICRSLDGKVLPMSEYSPGSTAPPFHPYCRTTTVPYFEDDIGERAARDEEGKYYTVPSNMTYKEWEKTVEEREKATHAKRVEAAKPLHEAMQKSGVMRLPDIDKFAELQYNDSPAYKRIVARYQNLTGEREWSAVEFNPETIADHLARHGKGLGVTTVSEYEAAALKFVNGKIKKELLIAEDGIRRMYNKSENLFASVYPDGTISTFFKPKEARKYWEGQVKKYGKQ